MSVQLSWQAEVRTSAQIWSWSKFIPCREISNFCLNGEISNFCHKNIFFHHESQGQMQNGRGQKLNTRGTGIPLSRTMQGCVHEVHKQMQGTFRTGHWQHCQPRPPQWSSSSTFPWVPRVCCRGGSFLLTNRNDQRTNSSIWCFKENPFAQRLS